MYSSTQKLHSGCRLGVCARSPGALTLLVFCAAIAGVGCAGPEENRRAFQIPDGPRELRLNSPETQQYARVLEAWIAQNGARGYWPSLGVGVVVGDQLVWSHYYRTAPDRRYGLASITKTITGLAVMQLADRGLLRLDDPVTRYLPNIEIARPELKSEPVLIRHLLSHTSGLPDMRYYENPEWMYPAETGLSYAIPKQAYPAGAHYRYSNHGFMLLGEIVERITGQRLPDHYRQAIFEPAGMHGAVFTERYTGAAGIQTTLPDLAAYAALWLNRGRGVRGMRILKEASVDRMLRPPVFYPEGENHAYCGLAWRVEWSGDATANFFHIGGANGIMAWVQMFPQYGAAIVYLGNPAEMTDEVMGRIPDLQNRLARLATLIVGAPRPLNYFAQSVAGPDTARRLGGVYRNPLNGAVIEIDAETAGAPRLQRVGRLSEELRPISTREFVGRYALYDFTFERGSDAPRGIATVQEYYLREDSGEATRAPGSLADAH